MLNYTPIPMQSIVEEKNPEGFPRRYLVKGFSLSRGLLIMELDPPHRMGYAQKGELVASPPELA
jgi:hypothetical protein